MRVNPYAYALGNPLRYGDPTGLSAREDARAAPPPISAGFVPGICVVVGCLPFRGVVPPSTGLFTGFLPFVKDDAIVIGPKPTFEGWANGLRVYVEDSESLTIAPFFGSSSSSSLLDDPAPVQLEDPTAAFVDGVFSMPEPTAWLWTPGRLPPVAGYGGLESLGAAIGRSEYLRPRLPQPERPYRLPVWVQRELDDVITGIEAAILFQQLNPIEDDLLSADGDIKTLCVPW